MKGAFSLTATEVNNDFFTVERTLDGITYEEILQMPGAGNSFSPITYIAYDNEPLPGTSYYRLKQTDYDGSYEYSPLVELYNPYISNISNFAVINTNDDIIVEGRTQLNFPKGVTITYKHGDKLSYKYWSSVK